MSCHFKVKRNEQSNKKNLLVDDQMFILWALVTKFLEIILCSNILNLKLSLITYFIHSLLN